jgi:hypothetical protein
MWEMTTIGEGSFKLFVSELFLLDPPPSLKESLSHVIAHFSIYWHHSLPRPIRMLLLDLRCYRPRSSLYAHRVVFLR